MRNINIQIIITIVITLILLTGFYFEFFEIIFYILLIFQDIFIRLVIGLFFGFVLSRAAIGFAGSINKLYRINSASLSKALLFMFVLTSIFVSFVIYGNENSYNLNIYPINLGLIIGGLMFGVGMSFSSCCATGSLCDLGSGFSRALTTILFFGMGVFLGFYLQGTASWIKESWISSITGLDSKGGVFFPDLFKFDGLNGYLGAIILTSILALFFSFLAHRYQKKYLKKSEKTNKIEFKNITKLLTYENIFIKNWNIIVGVVFISLIFTMLIILTGKGWSATSAFGLWFAKILMLFGVSAETLSDFTTRSVDFFSQSIFSYGTSVQNFGIILGVFISLLLSKTFINKFKSGLKINFKGFVLFAIGGFIMGLGTRLSNGCNVGALYTPIAEFSLSGWIYLVFVVIGGVYGNIFLKKIVNKN